MPRVLIIQSEMKHYRVPFFNGLYSALSGEGIDLLVVYSNTSRFHGMLNDRAQLQHPAGRRVKGTWIFDRLLYQHVWGEISRADLVIVGPEIKYLANPILLMMAALRLKTVAFWGLGPNRYPTRSPFAEHVKKPFFTSVDWWFSYTPSVTQYLIDEGMAAEKITTVYNSIDTTQFRRFVEDIPADEVRTRKVELTGNTDGPVGLYCGALSEIKDIPFLVESMRLVKQKCPDFHFVVVGDGPNRLWLEEATKRDKWIHCVGFQSGRDSALYYRMADVFAMGGTAGLAIVDCFAAGLPLFVTDLPTHPPEISYVRDDYNGRITPHNSGRLASAIAEFLSNPDLKERLSAGAKAAGEKLTMQYMIQNYKVGVMRCLDYHSSARSLRAPGLCRKG